MKIAPGVRMNLNKGGPSFRFGPKGAGVTVGSKGTRASAGIPGTGLSYSEKIGDGRAPGWGWIGKVLVWGFAFIVVLVVVAALL
jgi:hypothetical protein